MNTSTTGTTNNDNTIVCDYGINTNNPIIPMDSNTKIVLLFWAPWHEASVIGGPMDTILKALATSSVSSSSNNKILFGRVHAEDNMELTDRYNVTAVPTFVLLHENGTLFELVEGCEDVSQITQAVQRLLQVTTTSAATGGADINNNVNNLVATTTSTQPLKKEENDGNDDDSKLQKHIQNLIRSSEVMLFIKGTPDTPKCGFTRQVIQIMIDENIHFNSFDILTDETIRQGLKKYSNWPTYPQIYVHGELIGGLDILKELVQEIKEEGKETLRQQWNRIESSSTSTTGSTTQVLTIEEKCQQLIKQDYVMLFMKGLPSTPRCGFSRTIVELLNQTGIPYGAFDILQDDDIRQTLKQISNWPTYPQLYVNGELIGGLDIVQELVEDGTLVETLSGGSSMNE
jgi:Grx4 family monothiol glutaredoxin